MTLPFTSFSLQCASEKRLDREVMKQKIVKDLKAVVTHSMQLEELWDQREANYMTTNRMSSQFLEFESEIKKVSFI